MMRERSGQIRGMSDLYWGVAHMKNMDRVWDATIERMVLESIQMGWITANPNDMKQQAGAMAASARGRSSNSESGTTVKNYETELVPGSMPIWENKDHQINFTDLKTPSNNFVNAIHESLAYCAQGRGYAPEFIRGEYSTSFTAHKGALNDCMKTISLERQRYVDQVEELVNLEYLKHYVRTGMLEVMPGFWDNHYIQQAYLSGKWIGEVPGHVNPLQEVKSNIEAVGAGFMLRADAAANNGYSDFEAFLDEREDQEREFKARSGEEQSKIIMNESEGEMPE
jgi:capsid protein